MKAPKISCVMPCRNRADIIGESIKSIISQTFKDWELIIIDDHSDAGDKTEEVIKNFNDRRIRYYELDDKYGNAISAARNFGNMLAVGEYIALQDSDDLSYDYRFELTLEAFEKNGADVVYGDMDFWYPETGEIKSREGEFAAREFSIKELKKNDFIPNSSCSYKRMLAVDFPYNTFFRVAEDYDFFSRLAKYGYKFHFVNRSFTKYRVHEKSITKVSKYQFNYGQLVKFNRGWVDAPPQMYKDGEFLK